MELVQELAGIKVELARHDERIQDHERWQKAQNGSLKEIRQELEEIKGKLQDMKDDFGNRPTWSVTVVITALSTFCVGMAVYIVTNL